METFLTLLYGAEGGEAWRYHRLSGRTKIQAALITREEHQARAVAHRQGRRFSRYARR